VSHKGKEPQTNFVFLAATLGTTRNKTSLGRCNAINMVHCALWCIIEQKYPSACVLHILLGPKGASVAQGAPRNPQAMTQKKDPGQRDSNPDLFTIEITKTNISQGLKTRTSKERK
jgi:hypothetical protein